MTKKKNGHDVQSLQTFEKFAFPMIPGIRSILGSDFGATG
jgi:hypothetical protein